MTRHRIYKNGTYELAERKSYETNLLDIKDNERAKEKLRIMSGCNYMISKKLQTPYPEETVESYNGEYTQEEIDIAEAIFAWWISGKGYTKWYAENIAQQKIDFDIGKD